MLKSPAMKFTVLKKSRKSRARAGLLETPHGVIETPVFMPVGTLGTVKSLTPDLVAEQGTQIILANTYHLFLRPGPELLARAGGLHRFMHWDKPILTDSGGFQVFSLSRLRKISADGVEFQSPLDGGARHQFTPELVVDIQRQLGSDIMMPLDICSAPADSPAKVAQDMRLTIAWEKRAQKHFALRQEQDEPGTGRQALFGLIQGGLQEDLRREAV